MKNSHTFLRTAVVVGLSLTALVACDRKDDTTPPVAMASSDSVNSDMGLRQPGDQSQMIDHSQTDQGATSAGARNDSGTAMSATVAVAGNAAPPLTDSEQRFVRTASEAGMYEVAVAQLAVERSQDGAVKQLAERLLADHLGANESLRQIVAGRASLSSDLPADKQAIVDKMSRLKGADFDRQFLQQLGTNDHQQNVELFEKAQRDVQDPQLKTFIESTLPTLKHHLSTAKDVKIASKAAQ